MKRLNFTGLVQIYNGRCWSALSSLGKLFAETFTFPHTPPNGQYSSRILPNISSISILFRSIKFIGYKCTFPPIALKGSLFSPSLPIQINAQAPISPFLMLKEGDLTYFMFTSQKKKFIH